MTPKTEAEWRETLSDEEYRVLRKKGTERPFTGKYDKHFEEGTYICRACSAPLFTSHHKFDAGCGWPSFDKEIKDGAITTHRDTSMGMIRTEICCSTCGSHLGHVFDDGPTPTGLRYCVNSISLQFKTDQNT